ncbi:MAG: two component transcriptional regulator, LuxR family [Dehalococcoidia bacterium]|nr:two component transcriptional regulator, LuxR family [Dehalococcoidia bacterium]
MDKIRVLIADDHAILREGVRALLAMYADIEVVGEASDGREAIDKTRDLSPEVVLMDIAMPGLGGLEATMEIRKASPQSKVLVLTQYDNKEYLLRFLKAGAAGYVLKKAVGSELVSAIRSVRQGGRFIHPLVADKLIEDYLRKSETGDEKIYDTLSDREKEVLKLVAEGHSNKDIAGLLGLSVKTVMAHRSNLMEKLGIHNRTDLIRYAIRQGLIQVQPEI